MRKLFLGVAGAALTAAALSGCGEDSAPTFAEKVAMSDMYEIEAGRIAADKGQAPAIKDFGQQMVDAHTGTTNELKSIVEAENIDVTLPTKLDDTHQDLIDDLNEASAEDFDEEYKEQQVDAHQDAIDLFEDYAEDGDNGALKDFASKTLPTLRDHLKMAKDLPEDGAGTAGTAMDNDAATDTAPDAGTDMAPDAGTDMAPDAGTDMTPDAGPAGSPGTTPPAGGTDTDTTTTP